MPLGGKDTHTHTLLNSCTVGVKTHRVVFLLKILTPGGRWLITVVLSAAPTMLVKKSLSFYRFPVANKESCERWVVTVRGKDWQPKPHSRICNEHCISSNEP